MECWEEVRLLKKSVEGIQMVSQQVALLLSHPTIHACFSSKRTSRANANVSVARLVQLHCNPLLSRTLEESKGAVILSSHVFTELMNVLGKKLGHQKPYQLANTFSPIP